MYRTSFCVPVCHVHTYILLAFSGVSNSLYRLSTCCSLDSSRTFSITTIIVSWHSLQRVWSQPTVVYHCNKHQLSTKSVTTPVWGIAQLLPRCTRGFQACTVLTTNLTRHNEKHELLRFYVLTPTLLHIKYFLLSFRFHVMFHTTATYPHALWVTSIEAKSS